MPWACHLNDLGQWQSVGPQGPPLHRHHRYQLDMSIALCKWWFVLAILQLFFIIFFFNGLFSLCRYLSNKEDTYLWVQRFFLLFQFYFCCATILRLEKCNLILGQTLHRLNVGKKQIVTPLYTVSNKIILFLSMLMLLSSEPIYILLPG